MRNDNLVINMHHRYIHHLIQCMRIDYQIHLLLWLESVTIIVCGSFTCHIWFHVYHKCFATFIVKNNNNKINGADLTKSLS